MSWSSCILLSGTIWWSLDANADTFAAQPVYRFLFLHFRACPCVRNGRRAVPLEVAAPSISHGHRRLVQAGKSGYRDMYIHMQAPSAFLPLTVRSLFICCKNSFLSGITWMIPGQVFLSYHWTVVYVLVFCHESQFPPPSFWWWTHECCPKPRTKRVKTPSHSNTLTQLYFFFF